jgi:glyoxylase-like metal-dependent hydrolase (beta-lactamase superfamily II)
LLNIQAFFDPTTFSYTYLVSSDGEAAIVDPVYDFDPFAGELAPTCADRVITALADHNLTLKWILETHVHADHLSAAQYIKSQVGGQICAGANVGLVQQVFAKVFNAEDNFHDDGRQFDVLLAEDETLKLGRRELRVLSTPGHTPSCVCYVIDGNVFVGDTLFMPDYGTVRNDFPGGCAKQLYGSIQKILSLPDDTRLYMCHDYGTEARPEFQYLTTVSEQKAYNIHIGGNKTAAEFVRFRTDRDAQLSAPRLLYPAVQFNMRAGKLPQAEANGSHYFKIPIKRHS